MKILILVDRYKPNPISGARMMEELAIEFTERKHEVTVLSTDHDLNQKYVKFKDDGIEVIKVNIGKINNPSKIIRTFIEVTLSYRIWAATKKILTKKKHDLIICYSPTIFWSGLISRLKSLHKTNVYLVLRDLFPHWLVDAKVISKFNPIYYYFLHMEKKLYNLSSRIGVQSPTNLDFFKNNIEFSKFEILYNWTKPEIKKSLKISKYFENQIKNKLVLVYGGNIGVAQDISNILNLARNLEKNKKIIFLIIGDGTEYEKMNLIIKKNNLKNVIIHPSILNMEYQAVLNKSDIGLISLNKNLRTENLPGKMLEYMKYSLPILASINKGNNFDKLIHEHSAGFVSFNGDDKTFKKNALMLINDKLMLKKTSKNSKNLLNKIFHVKSAADRILESVKIK